ncbi:hypothetical protein GCM10027168_63200 [Streptomyces capparidis]
MCQPDILSRHRMVPCCRPWTASTVFGRRLLAVGQWLCPVRREVMGAAVGDELLELTVSHSGGSVAVVAVAGDVDLHTSPDLRAAAAELVETGRHHLVLDLSEVDFFDSSGLSTLVGIWKVVQARGGSLKLAAVPDRLQRMLALTGLAAYMPVHPTTAAALAAHHT